MSCPRCGAAESHWHPQGRPDAIGYYLCDPPIKLEGVSYPRDPCKPIGEIGQPEENPFPSDWDYRAFAVQKALDLSPPTASVTSSRTVEKLIADAKAIEQYLRYGEIDT